MSPRSSLPDDDIDFGDEPERTLAGAALALAEEGLYVFPLKPQGKVPLTAHGLDDATIDQLTIETWWDRWPNANIGLRTGDLVVVDEDKAGAFGELAEQHGHQLPETRTVRTDAGRHYYFSQANGTRIRNTAGKLAAGIDTRGDGGYVVAPPSVHPNGSRYELECDAPLAPFPHWIAELLKPRPAERHTMAPIYVGGETTPYGAEALEQELAAVAGAPEGTRNHRLNSAAFALGQLVAGGEVDEHDALQGLETAAGACGLPPAEASRTIRSGFESGLADPRTAPERRRTLAPPEVTQTPESPESPAGSNGRGGRGDSVTQTHRVTGSTSPHPSVAEGDSGAESARPFALPVHAFVALDRPTAEPILADVDGRAVVGRHSLTLLGARGGAGKTSWFLDVALHLAAGVDYPPFTVARPVSVLMIENEGPEDLFAEKLELRLASFPHELQARLDVCTFDWGGFSLANDEHRGRLVDEIAASGYELVFGDPLDSLGIEGVGSPEDTRKFLALMKETGLNKTVAWWLNTHPRKEKTSEALDEISGAWGGKPDSVLLLRMLDDDRTQIRFPKLRWAKRGKRPAILLGFDAETEAFRYIGEESDDDRDYKAEVLELLSDGEWRTAKEIAATRDRGGVGANVDTVKRLLEEHVDLFESRTGDAAKAIGRSPSATVWHFQDADDPATPVDGEQTTFGDAA